MTLVVGPSIVRDSLIFSSDFANPKTYYPNENLWTRSEDITLSAGPSTSVLFFVNTATTLTPAGTTASTLAIMNTSTNNFAYSNYSYNTTAPSWYTMSFYVKPYNTSTLTLILGTNGFYPLTQAGTGTTYSVVRYEIASNTFYNQSVSNSSTNFNTIADYTYGAAPAAYGWTRVWMTANLTTATGIGSITGGFYPGEAGQTGLWYGKGFYVWGFQLERNSVPTAYVPTGATNVVKTTNVYDLTVPYTGAFVGTPSYNRDSVRFNETDNTTGTYCDITGLPVVGTSTFTNRTMSVWFKCNGPTNWGQEQGIVQYWDAVNNPLFNLTIINAGPAVAIYNSVQDWLGVSRIPSASASISFNTWYHAVGVENHDNGDRISMYINGNLISSNTYGYTATQYTGVANQVRIGAQKVGSVGRYFRGQVSNVELYNRSLSADEIKQLFVSMRGRYGL